MKTLMNMNPVNPFLQTPHVKAELTQAAALIQDQVLAAEKQVALAAKTMAGMMCCPLLFLTVRSVDASMPVRALS